MQNVEFFFFRIYDGAIVISMIQLVWIDLSIDEIEKK